MDNVYLLKFGGNAIKGEDDLARFASEISSLISEGARIILVHGGGPEINAEMERIGLVPKKVAGIRITDDETLDVAIKVLRGINLGVVDALVEAGVKAVGMPGYHVAAFERKKPYMVRDNGEDVLVDPMNVGEVTDVDLGVLDDLLSQGIVPVIYPIGRDERGYLNVNADAMASGIAAGVKCTEMIQITDVPGILLDINDPSSLQPILSLAQVDGLIADGTISGGMVPKVEACRRALMAGVAKVRMVNGKDKGNIVSDVMKEGVEHGTVIIK
ncbi:MAG: acetylglutamate kinase [Candidatus Methanomethylophilaceae archaeon]|nr:acetylglutamate kinase [Candidatus Methanomethylophilaceae archaeon]